MLNTSKTARISRILIEATRKDSLSLLESTPMVFQMCCVRECSVLFVLGSQEPSPQSSHGTLPVAKAISTSW
jgi:hypothetical protein